MRFSPTLLKLLTGIAVLPTGAYATNNAAFLDQGSLLAAGQNNLALIDQSSGSDNLAGTGATPLRQLGTSNQLTLIQSGDRNSTGTAPTGLIQTSALSAASNNALLLQHSSDNTIGAVRQASTATAGAAGNTLVIEQGLAGTPGTDGNSIDRVVQQRRGAQGNTASVLQQGANNSIALVAQISEGPGLAPNRIEIVQFGDDNGTAPLTGVADSVGATVGVYAQGATASGGADNSLSLEIIGDHNATGTRQNGTGNSMGDTLNPILIAGSDNAFGGTQSGMDNQLSLSILGDGNEVGTQQNGIANMITLDIGPASDSNSVLFGQAGTDNMITAAVTGAFNSATLMQTGSANTGLLTVTGDYNTIDGLQNGNGNSATVTQIGNANSAVFSQLGNNNTVTILQ